MSDMTSLSRRVSNKPVEVYEEELREFESMDTKPECWDKTIRDQAWSGDGVKLQVLVSMD